MREVDEVSPSRNGESNEGEFTSGPGVFTHSDTFRGDLYTIANGFAIVDSVKGARSQMPSNDPIVARLLRIAGRVQGVGYRDWLRRQARRDGLAGWVRNRRDGTVEAHVQGGAAGVERLVEACWSGPAAAVVTGIDIVPVDPLPDSVAEGEFQRLPTL